MSIHFILCLKGEVKNLQCQLQRCQAENKGGEERDATGCDAIA